MDLAIHPTLPRRRDWRIGVAGAGFIVRDCHLVAYRNAGFNPVAVASRNPATARAVADLRGVPRVHATFDDLLADEEIEVLDVAVPPDVQPDLIRRAVEKGTGRLRGILAQKPLALTVRDAKDLAARCAAAGVVLGVNQNMRYDQSVRAAKDILTRGWVGDPVLATIDMRAVPHWMPWAEGLSSLSTFVMSIHHLDTFRYWLGTPDRVLASTRPDPRTAFPHRDGINLYILEYDAGPRATAWDDVWAGPDSSMAEGGGGKAEKEPDIDSDSAFPPPPSAFREIRWRIEGDRRADAGDDRLAEVPGPGAEYDRVPHPPATPGRGSARGGTRCGSRTRSPARWRNCWSRSRTGRNRRSAAATTSKRSPCAKPSSLPPPNTASRR